LSLVKDWIQRHSRPSLRWVIRMPVSWRRRTRLLASQRDQFLSQSSFQQSHDCSRLHDSW